MSTDSSKFKASKELKYTDNVFAYKVVIKIDLIRGLSLKSATGLGGNANTSN